MKRQSQRVIILITVIACLGFISLSISVGYSMSERNESYVARHRVLRNIKTWSKPGEPPSPGFSPGPILEESAGRYWIGDVLFKRIYQYDEATSRWDVIKEFRSKYAFGIRTIYRGPDGKIWILSRPKSDQDSLKYFDDKQWHLASDLAQMSSKHSPSVLLPGQNGQLWIKFADGLLTYRHQEWTDYPEPKRELQKNYQSLCEARKIHGKPCDANAVLCGVATQDRRVWLGLSHGLLRFDETDRQWSVHPIPAELTGIYGIYADRKHRLWVSDIEGKIAVRDDSRATWCVYNLYGTAFNKNLETVSVGPIIEYMYQDKKGIMMFATSIGLVTLDEDRKEWRVYTAENSVLPSNDITMITEGPSGRILISTGSGIVVLEP